jgi:ABC-type proline/glycine betaine transport system substrate-binding protein
VSFGMANISQNQYLTNIIQKHLKKISYDKRIC